MTNGHFNYTVISTTLTDAIGGDWPGCARALLAHGMPRGEPDAEPDVVRVEGVRMRFSEEVADVLIAG